MLADAPVMALSAEQPLEVGVRLRSTELEIRDLHEFEQGN